MSSKKTLLGAEGLLVEVNLFLELRGAACCCCPDGCHATEGWLVHLTPRKEYVRHSHAIPKAQKRQI